MFTCYRLWDFSNFSDEISVYLLHSMLEGYNVCLAIVLSFILRLTASCYTFDIFKLF